MPRDIHRDRQSPYSVTVTMPTGQDCPVRPKGPVGIFSLGADGCRDVIATMQSYRNSLVRALAEIDGLLIEAECAVEDAAGHDRERALEVLIEFQEVQRFVEAELAEA